MVGVDGVYGPTETMVVIDDDSDPAVAAADMLAQAEHDVLAAPILVALSDAAVNAVESELVNQLEMLAACQHSELSVGRQGSGSGGRLDRRSAESCRGSSLLSTYVWDLPVQVNSISNKPFMPAVYSLENVREK